MTCDDLLILIPCHSLEDFPTELGEEDSASLLQAYSVAWHPLLIGKAGVVPRWHRVDMPPEQVRGKWIMLPRPSRDLLSPGWQEQAVEQGATLLVTDKPRDELCREIVSRFEGAGNNLDPELVADFLALGTCHLLMELLARKMRHSYLLDEGHLQREAVAAALAVLAHDAETARARLRNCFDVLAESRERFYPTDCYLIDLCLLIPDLADQHLTTALRQLKPFNILLPGEDLETIAQQKPEMIRELKEAWERNTISLIGGEYREAPNNLLPPNAWLWQLEKGRETYQKHLGKMPLVWGRRKYGLMPAVPQVLKHFGYVGALHLALDDGLYPDEEFSKIRWQGIGGTTIDSITRIPLAADTASSFLRFPTRMGESMDHDQVAAVLFARWPEVKSPWMEDLRRMQHYAPALGRWVTLEEFFQYTDTAGRLSNYDAGAYLGPTLLQAVAREERDPVSRHLTQVKTARQLEAAERFEALNQALRQKQVTWTGLATLAEKVELQKPNEPAEGLAAEVQQAMESHARTLAECVIKKGSPGNGVLVMNPISTPRRVVVPLDSLPTPPRPSGAVKFVQWSETHKSAVVDVPPCGFTYLAPGAAAETTGKPSSSPNLAEGFLVRNEFFEAEIHEETGGLARLKKPGRAPNRLSIQLGYRFPQERIIQRATETQNEVRSWYSHMQLTRTQVLSAGPVLGELETEGHLIDQTNGERLADFRIIYRVTRGRPYLEVDVELEVAKMPNGDPWSNYYALRFAWNDPGAALTRSLFQQAQGLQLQRVEAPDYLEIADASQRTTLLFNGLPFHRHTDERRWDTILITEGESHRKFRLAIAIDQSYPMGSAQEVFGELAVLPMQGQPAPGGESGWFFHCDSRNVLLLDITPVLPERVTHMGDHEFMATEPAPARPTKGCLFRIMETEGRPVRAELRTVYTPLRGRKTDGEGMTVIDLPVEGDTLVVHLSAFEIAWVEAYFE